MRVKIFIGLGSLSEDMINRWLQENPNITIIDKQLTSAGRENCITANLIIWYRDNYVNTNCPRR